MTVNQRVLGSSPRRGAKSLDDKVEAFIFNMHYVYILQSKTLNRFYVGQTQNLERRITFHRNPSNKKAFVAKAKDWELYYNIACNAKNQALAIEKHIKRMKSKTYIHNLKRYPEITQKLLLKYNLTVNQSPDSYRGWFEPKPVLM